MKNYVLLFLLLNVLSLPGQDMSFLKKFDCEVRLDESYGDKKRNKFDIVMPKSSKPTAIVIYIHGGGFYMGNKDEAFRRKKDIEFFLNNNIAFATVNYSYRKDDDKKGVKASLDDITRAVQFLKFNASKYNLDKLRFGVYGESAGAGAALYIALKDDMALENDKGIAGESTRVLCVGAMDTQATYNMFEWKKYIPGLNLFHKVKKTDVLNEIANFYGYKNYSAFKPHERSVVKSVDMLQMIDSNDPPVYIMNLLDVKIPKDDDDIQHHKKHAIVLSKKLNEFNVENHLYINQKGIEKESDIDYSVAEFLFENLKADI